MGRSFVANPGGQGWPGMAGVVGGDVQLLQWLDQCILALGEFSLQVAAGLFDRVVTAVERPSPIAAKFDQQRRFAAWIVCRGEQHIGIEVYPHAPAASVLCLMRVRSVSERASSASQRPI